MPFAKLTAFQNFVSLCKNLPLENLCVRTPFFETAETLRPLCKELFEHQTRLKHLTAATFGELVPDLLRELTRLQSLVLDLGGSEMNNDLSEVIPPSLSNLTSLTVIDPELGQHCKTIYGLETLTRLRSFSFAVHDHNFLPWPIFSHLINLRELSMHGAMEPDALNVLNVKLLTSVKLSNIKEPSPTFLQRLAELPNLVALTIREWPDDLREEDILPFTRLTRLSLKHRYIGRLSSKSTLEQVELSHRVDLKGCTRLTRAVFHHDVDLLREACLPSLKDLAIYGMSLADPQVTAHFLAQATQLTRLALVTHPESLYKLNTIYSQLSNLRELCIYRTEMDQAGQDHVIQVSLANEQFAGEIFSSLTDNSNLHVLTIPGLHSRGNFYEEEIENLRRLTQLSVLNVFGKPVPLPHDLKCHVEFRADEPDWSL